MIKLKDVLLEDFTIALARAYHVAMDQKDYDELGKKVDRDKFKRYFHIPKDADEDPNYKRDPKFNIKKLTQLKESDKRASNKAYDIFYNAYKQFANATMDVAKSATKINGQSTDEKIILKNFKKQVIPFIGLMQSWNKGQQANPSMDETISESPDNDMFRDLNKVNNDIFKIMNKYDGKADMDAIFRSWMLGIHSHLKKAGIKLK